MESLSRRSEESVTESEATNHENETKDIKEYEANLFAIELLPQIYNNFSIDYHDLNKEEMQAFMNKKISHIIYSL